MTEDNREPNPEEPARPDPAGPAPTSHGADQASAADQPPSPDRPPTRPAADQPTPGSSTPSGQPATASTPPGDQPGPALFGGQPVSGGQPAGERSPFAPPSADRPSFGGQPSTGAASFGAQPVYGSPTGQALPGDQPNFGSTADPAPSGDQVGPSLFGSQPPAGEQSPFARPAFAPYGDRPAADPAAASTMSFGDRPPVEQPTDQAPAASFAASGGDTPSRAHTPPTGERVLFGTAFNQGGGHQPPPGSYPAPAQPLRVGPNQPPREPRKGAPGLVAGLTVLALLVGGGAGAVGGYIVAENNQSNGPVENALDQPRPAERTSTAPGGSVEAVAEKVLPSVVQLQVRGRSSAGEGSGFVISSDGLIVTNNHVVEAAAESGQIVAVFHDGSTASASIVGRDPTSDVAVVKADKTGLPVAELGRSDDLRVGESVVAIGSPFELSGTVTSGIVSSLQRPTRAGGEDGSQATVMDAIQTDAAINPGNSGGPLVNMQGQVIGINSAIYSPTGGGQSQGGSVGIGFAIPIDQARRTADEIVKTGKATQTILGVTVRDGEQGGALIVEVTGNGPGANAGLKQGDVVTKLDERKIDTSDALVAAVRSHKPGDKVRLELSNGSRTVEATLAGQPVETE